MRWPRVLTLRGPNSLSKINLFLSTAAGKMADLRDMRKPYKSPSETFTESNLPSLNPVEQFGIWFKEAKDKCHSFEEANAVSLATASKEGMPTCRMVLLKSFDSEGFKFFTNYKSRKGRELEENPKASIMSYWPTLNRSVRIEGTVAKLSAAENEDYWNRRPLESQASAFISDQSSLVASRQVLLSEVTEVLARYAGSAIPRPADWGGYVLRPESFEFWQGQSNRLHDRIRFRRPGQSEVLSEMTHEGQDGWVYERLAP